MLDSLDVTMSRPLVEVAQGSRVELACSIRTNRPEGVKITWARQGTGLEGFSIHRKRRILTRLVVGDFGVEDVGVYQCRNS